MKKIYFLLLALTTLAATSACRVEKADDGEPPVTRHIEAKDFESIAITFPADVTFIPSDTFGVDVKAPASQMEKVGVKVEDGQLQIYKNEKEDGADKHYIVFNSRGGMQITVRAPRLISVSLAGSGSFACNDTLRSNHLSLAIAGSGDIKAKHIEAKEVEIAIAGSGDVEAALAHVDKTDISIAGSGDVDVDFKACKSVYASILGSGDISLGGEVESLTKDIAGSGDIDTHKLKTRE